MNNILYANTARYLGSGIGSWNSYPIIINTIVWPDPEQRPYYAIEGGTPEVTYSNIWNGYNGQGNINVDPLFRDPENGDFHLMSTECLDLYDSPCIDAGDPAIFDSILDCDWGLGEERSDMGAYGGQAIPTDIREEHPPTIPIACGLFQNYPNPFNAATTLSYMLPKSGSVTISIYNLLGQRVATICEGIQQAGQHSITWDASDFPSGVYFARLEAGEYSKSIKMVLLK